MTQNSAPAAAVGASSHRRILWATSLLGGATAVNVLLGMVRTKCVALLLGPSGVGLMGMFMSITGLAQTIAGCGLATGGVKELAAAQASGAVERVSVVHGTFWRLSWWLGLGGALLVALLAWPVSRVAFGHGEHAGAIAVLAVTVTIGLVGTYFSAVIQGAQDMRGVVRMNIWGGVLGTLVSLLSFALWGERGIVPALVSGAVVQLALAWFSARRHLPPDGRGAYDPEVARRLFALGGLMLMLAVMASLGFFCQRLLIVRVLGETGVGIFQAAFSLSGLYAGYILGAMGTDFLPRLSAVADDDVMINRLVNEQTVVAVLLGLPGIVGTVVFAGYVVPIFYSGDFGPAVEALRLMAVGVFGRLISWPMGYVLIAKGDVRRNFWIELVGQVNMLLPLWLLLPVVQDNAAGLAVIWMYLCHTLLIRRMVGTMTGFQWTPEARQVLALGLAGLAVAVALVHGLTGLWQAGVGVAWWGLVTVLTLRSLWRVAGDPNLLAKLRARLWGKQVQG